MLRIHPEGFVWINDTQATKAEVEAIVGTLDVPDGVGVEYDGQRSVRFVRGDQFPGPLPWLAGDAVLANAASVVAEIKRRRQLLQDITVAEAAAREIERRAALEAWQRAVEDLDRHPLGRAVALALALHSSDQFNRQAPLVQEWTLRILREARDAAIAVLDGLANEVE